ncbi:MAG: hypothetical protein ABEJ23_10140 [Haloarculaceae archaeon]
MSDRVTELERLASDLAGRDDVASAWLARSFQTRVLFVEVPADATLPDGVRTRVRDAGLAGVNEVYDPDAGEPPAFTGRVGTRDQYRFVDVRDRTAQTQHI